MEPIAWATADGAAARDASGEPEVAPEPDAAGVSLGPEVTRVAWSVAAGLPDGAVAADGAAGSEPVAGVALAAGAVTAETAAWAVLAAAVTGSAEPEPAGAEPPVEPEPLAAEPPTEPAAGGADRVESEWVAAECPVEPEPPVDVEAPAEAEPPAEPEPAAAGPELLAAGPPAGAWGPVEPEPLPEPEPPEPPEPDAGRASVEWPASDGAPDEPCEPPEATALTWEDTLDTTDPKPADDGVVSAWACWRENRIRMTRIPAASNPACTARRAMCRKVA